MVCSHRRAGRGARRWTTAPGVPRAARAGPTPAPTGGARRRPLGQRGGVWGEDGGGGARPLRAAPLPASTSDSPKRRRFGHVLVINTAVVCIKLAALCKRSHFWLWLGTSSSKPSHFGMSPARYGGRQRAAAARQHQKNHNPQAKPPLSSPPEPKPEGFALRHWGGSFLQPLCREGHNRWRRAVIVRAGITA